MDVGQVSGPRVVVTGYGIHGAVPAIGEAIAALNLRHCLIGWQTISDGLRCVGAAATAEPVIRYLAQKKWLKYMGPATQFAVWAAGKALEQAGLYGDEDAAKVSRESMALYIATGPIAFALSDVLPGLCASLGSDGQIDPARLGTEGLRHSSPMMPFHTLLNMPIGLVSMNFGIKGQNAIFYPDVEQTLFAFSAAIRAIRSDRARVAMVGGTAQLLSPMPMVTHQRRGLLAATPDVAIPFRAGHQGLAIGDAAAMIILEQEAHARARGAKIYGILDAESSLLTNAELAQRLAADPEGADCILVSGTRNAAEDDEIARIGRNGCCVSMDSIFGYAGPASVALELAAACQLLDSPALLDNGAWQRRGALDVLAANANEQPAAWARLHLEAYS